MPRTFVPEEPHSILWYRQAPHQYNSRTLSPDVDQYRSRRQRRPELQCRPGGYRQANVRCCGLLPSWNAQPCLAKQQADVCTRYEPSYSDWGMCHSLILTFFSRKDCAVWRSEQSWNSFLKNRLCPTRKNRITNVRGNLQFLISSLPWQNKSELLNLHDFVCLQFAGNKISQEGA